MELKADFLQGQFTVDHQHLRAYITMAAPHAQLEHEGHPVWTVADVVNHAEMCERDIVKRLRDKGLPANYALHMAILPAATYIIDGRRFYNNEALIVAARSQVDAVFRRMPK